MAKKTAVKKERTEAPGFRDRIKELRRVRAGDLVVNPKNWRTHPDGQKGALAALLVEIGWADALIARPIKNGKLELVDGHLRAGIHPDVMVPVLVVDLNEREAEKVLLSLDPLAAMAESNREALRELLKRVTFADDRTDALIAKINADYLAVLEKVNDPGAAWGGMPEFEQTDKTAFRSLVVHFKDEAAFNAFQELVGHKITNRYMWYPTIQIEPTADKRYDSES